MGCATLMVHLQLGQANLATLGVAADLADRFHASVIGIVACQPVQIIDVEGSYSGSLIQQDREEIDSEIAKAEAEFRRAFEKRAQTLEWRSTISFGALPDYLAREARSCDLFVTGVDHERSLLDSARHLNVGDLVMQIGRPILIVPAHVETFKLERALVAWRDTRESRRAIFDALPLLKAAAHVAVLEIAPTEDLVAARARLRDVAAWLARNGVEADSLVLPSGGDDAAQIKGVAREQQADLLVAGAYGHSRLREWVLGGVTRDLLLNAPRCALVSH